MCRYLKSWFVIDFASTLPLDHILDFSTSMPSNGKKNPSKYHISLFFIRVYLFSLSNVENALRTLRLIRVIRLVRLFRLVRLTKLKQIVQLLEDSDVLLEVSFPFPFSLFSPFSLFFINHIALPIYFLFR